MKTKSKLHIILYFSIVVSVLVIIARKVVMVDPFFHYHKPYIETYFYNIDNERSQNDGIIKNFDYDAIIIGTSMTKNFMTSEMDSLFGVNSIKVPFSGGSYKEVNDNLANALACHPDLKIVVRGLDMSQFFDYSDKMVDSEFPTYLYDNNIFNDVRYIFNRDVVFGRVYPMTQNNDVEGFVPGITTFDNYRAWFYKFGVNAVCPDGIIVREQGNPVHISKEEKEIIQDNIYQNVISLAEQYPETTFYYFFPPYSIIWWKGQVESGMIYRQIEAEEYIIEQILECPNIKLYSFNNRTDITTDLNNYQDLLHYGKWINSLILKWMYNNQYILTKENYEDYLSQVLSFYTSYDYSLLQDQEDYENNNFVEALLNEELYGVEPLEILIDFYNQYELENARVIENQYDNMPGIECKGSLQREPASGISVADFLMNSEYSGIKISMEGIEQYRYLVFYGKKNSDQGQPTVYIYDENNKVVTQFSVDYREIDNDWHQYIINIPKVTGGVTIMFNGAYIDNTGNEESSYIFSGMTLY